MRIFYLVLMCCFTSFTGCSGGVPDGRLEVSGTVNLKGKPIADGAIVTLSPRDGQDTEAMMMTVGGAFKLPAMNGLKPGKYLVRVSLGDGKTAIDPVNPDEPPGPSVGTNIVSKELVPANWNTNSKQEITVTKEGPNVFPFEIP